MEKASYKLAVLVALIFSTICYLQGSVEATETTGMKGMPCVNDDDCKPYCPKSCKRVFCNQKPSSNYHFCFCENANFSPQQMLIAIPCVIG
uniref:Knottin scorpion toxin-like domain-containing protein n=1 Tax=Salix viminalis TaxID=40686 RepID=A0A6N2LPJ5_SALVM